MPDVITTKDYFDLAKQSYDDDLVASLESREGWNIIGQTKSFFTGYVGVAYQGPNGSITIAHRGTNFTQPGDVISDVQIANQDLPLQFGAANKFTDKIMAEFGDKVVHTGHSLGGGLAQLMAHKHDTQAVTFDPPGMVEIIEKHKHVLGNKEINGEDFTTVVVKNSLVSASGTQIFGDGITKVNLNMDSTNIDFQGHSMDVIEGAFSETGGIAEEYILNMSTITESSVNQLANFVFNNESLNDLERVAKLIELGGDEMIREMIKNEAFDLGDQIGDAVMEKIANAYNQINNGIDAGLEAVDGVKDQVAEGIEDVLNGIGGTHNNAGDQPSHLEEEPEYWTQPHFEEEPVFVTQPHIGEEPEPVYETQPHFGDEPVYKTQPYFGDESEEEAYPMPEPEFDSSEEIPASDTDLNSDNGLADLTQDLSANMDLLFQNIEKYKGVIQGI